MEKVRTFHTRKTGGRGGIQSKMSCTTEGVRRKKKDAEQKKMMLLIG